MTGDSPPPLSSSPGRRPHAFPKWLRVRTRREFDRVFEEGRSARGEGAVLICRRNELPYARFGVSVGRRFGGAVRRNRARRLAREAFRLDRERWPSGYDFVLVPRTPGFPDRLEEVRALLRDLARRAADRYEREGPRPSAQPRRGR